jgi:hypothetical protein
MNQAQQLRAQAQQGQGALTEAGFETEKARILGQ